MYCITDQHIEYVLNDIRRNGIETEDLQFNLLDHICCLAEHNLEAGDSFEDFYQKTIGQFYKKNLKEIEEETVLLLTFKYYYTMKKIMFAGGGFAVAAFLSGSLFKVMHWPGAAMLLTIGIALLSFLFLPLLFVLKAREVNTGLEKLTVALGTLLGILFCLDILFSVMHWPGATILWLSTICLSIFIFIPLYFFTGIRRPETRTNTILTSIVLIGFTGLLFTAINLRPSVTHEANTVHSYLQNEQIWHQLEGRSSMVASTPSDHEALNIIQLSTSLKAKILKAIAGNKAAVPAASLSFRTESLQYLDAAFNPGGDATRQLIELQQAIQRYNGLQSAAGTRIDMEYSPLLEPADRIGSLDNLYILNSITQLQINLATIALLPPAAVAQR